eukprot:3779113-Rhodomonas_salina.1
MARRASVSSARRQLAETHSRVQVAESDLERPCRCNAYRCREMETQTRAHTQTRGSRRSTKAKSVKQQQHHSEPDDRPIRRTIDVICCSSKRGRDGTRLPEGNELEQAQEGRREGGRQGEVGSEGGR